jgi:aerobic carbon-monoxide dehydrogenase large subunit
VRSGIGDAPKRREDLRFLTGSAHYLDDLAFANLAHALILRSPHAHARLGSIDAAAACARPGVLAVLTAADVQADGLKPLWPSPDANVHNGEKFRFMPQPLLAADRVRYVGEPVALVVADSPARALDAAELVHIDYAPLAAVIDPAAARAPGAPEIAAEAPGNLCFEWLTGDTAAVAAAFSAAAQVVALKIDNHRVVTNPIEPRGIVGIYDAGEDRYSAWVSAQSIHTTRDRAATALGIEATQLRLIAPDVGGGFGAKNFIYPEHVLLPWAARRVGRPVKWIAGRGEIFQADHQGRGHHAEAELALDRNGRFLALRVASTADLGAYLAGGAGVQCFQYAFLPGTVYRIPAVELRIAAVYTNTAPIGVLRGPGYGEANNIIERLIDAAAVATGIGRIELRQRNLVPAAAMPLTNALGNSIDSGAFPQTFDKALAAADIGGFASRQRRSGARGQLRGLGIVYHVKGTGGAPSENVDIRFKADGRVALVTGTQTIGQGHETTFPQILADRLGLPNELIHLVQGDTDLTPIGGGHGSSRATYMGGTAIWRAAELIVEKGRRVAAEALEAAEADIAFVDGDFIVAGTDRRIALLDIAKLARESGAPLDTYYAWTREWMTFPNGAHVAEVELDPETGLVRLDRYSAVDDYGVLVNPMVAAGQAHGAIAQGVGQALLEETCYDAASGQLIAGSFMDYAMPRADDLPRSRSCLIPRAVPPIRWVSKAAAKPAWSPRSRRSATRSATLCAAPAPPELPATLPAPPAPSVSGAPCGRDRKFKFRSRRRPEPMVQPTRVLQNRSLPVQGPTPDNHTE